MAQKIFTTFRAAVESFPLGEQNVGLFKPGRYSGFDVMEQSLSGGLSIEIKHSGTINKTQNDGNQAPAYGSILMPTGIIIHDDDTLKFNVQSNTGNLNQRIDWLICENEYQAVEGGTPAFYSIIQGPNDGTEPVIPDPTKQILIGKLKIEAGSSSYTGLTYEPSIANLPGDLTYQQLTSIINNVVVFPDATNTIKGIAMLATFAELEAGVITNKIVTPYTLAQLLANETRKGLSRKASSADITAGTDNDSFVTPLYLKQLFDIAVQAAANALSQANTYTDNNATPDATETVKGKAMIATQAEADSALEDSKFITPKKLHERRASNTLSGILKIITAASAASDYNLANSTYGVTPSALFAKDIKPTKFSFGTGVPNNVSYGSQYMFNYNFNYIDVYPPTGYSIYDFVACIPSLAEINFNGDVNQDDSFWCTHTVQYTNGRVRIIGAASYQRLRALINYLIIWQKST